MAMNPMQRKANNSFLLGIVITLVITGAIIAFLIFQVMNLNKEMEDQQASLTTVYVLSQDVTSGQLITSDLFTTMDVYTDTVPYNAIANLSTLSTYYLADSQGNEAYTGYKFRDTTNILPDIEDSNGDGYKIIDGATYEALTTEELNVLTDMSTVQYIFRNNEYCEIVTDELSGTYYIQVPEGTGTNKTYVREVLEEMPLIAKIDLYANTVITPEMFAEGQLTRDDLRTQEYNVIIPQSQLSTGDYIDVRLRLPDGQDLIVVSHKEVTIPEMADGTTSINNILMNLTEEEILTMSCAIVESYQMNGAMLYSTKYVEPGMQDASTPTYVPNDRTIVLINSDPNIVQEAKNALITRYNESRDTIRPGINGAVNHEDAADNVIDKTEEEISGHQEERELYIESLGY